MPAPHAPEPPTLELPELDKADDSEDVDVGAFELSLGDELGEEDEHDALEAFEVDIQEQVDAGSSEAASDLDIGMDQLIDPLPEAPADGNSEAPPPGSSDLDLNLDAPLETDEPISDVELGDDGLEELPDLLTEDVEGDGPELERGLLPGAPEGNVPKGPPYAVDWLLLGDSCTALAATSDSALACGERFMRFGTARASLDLPPATRVEALAELPSGAVLLATTRGLCELGASGSVSTTELPELMRGSSAHVTALVAPAGSQQVWARLSNGALLRRRAGVWARHEASGNVRSLTSRDSHVSLLIVAERPTLELSSDGGSSFRELLLPEPAATVALGAAPSAVAHGNVVAIADPERGLCVSCDGGESFRMVTGAVNVTALAIGERSGVPCVFAALYREGRDLSELLLIEPQSAAAFSVAELSSEPDEDAEETGRTSALVWLDGSIYAAGGFGLAKLTG